MHEPTRSTSSKTTVLGHKVLNPKLETGLHPTGPERDCSFSLLSKALPSFARYPKNVQLLPEKSYKQQRTPVLLWIPGILYSNRLCKTSSASMSGLGGGISGKSALTLGSAAD